MSWWDRETRRFSMTGIFANTLLSRRIQPRDIVAVNREFTDANLAHKQPINHGQPHRLSLKEIATNIKDVDKINWTELTTNHFWALSLPSTTFEKDGGEEWETWHFTIFFSGWLCLCLWSGIPEAAFLSLATEYPLSCNSLIDQVCKDCESESQWTESVRRKTGGEKEILKYIGFS